MTKIEDGVSFRICQPPRRGLPGRRRHRNKPAGDEALQRARPPRVPRSAVLSYSVGSIGTGIYLTVPSVLLLFYMTDILGVSPALAGLAVFIPRLWDVVTDPMMGFLSDRTSGPWGRRRPYLLIGALATAGSFIFLFNTPEFDDPANAFLFVLIIYILSATAYTVFAVPYLAMPAEMSEDSQERASIMAYRMTFAMAGVLAGSAAAPALVSAFGGGRSGFAGMSLVLGGMCALTMLVSFFGTAKAPLVNAPAERAGGRPSILRGFRDPDFRMLALAYGVQLGGLGIFTAIAPFFVRTIAGRDEAALGTMFLCLLAGTMASLFAWTILARFIGKARAYTGAAGLVVLSLAGLWMAGGPEAWPLILVTTFFIGAGFGGLQVLPFAMLTDVIQHARLRGDDLAGVLTGVWTAVEKGGLAVGPLIVGGLLSLGGFVPGAESQADSARFTVRAAMSLGPAVLVLLSLPAIVSARGLKSDRAVRSSV